MVCGIFGEPQKICCHEALRDMVVVTPGGKRLEINVHTTGIHRRSWAQSYAGEAQRARTARNVNFAQATYHPRRILNMRLYWLDEERKKISHTL
jgi:hypothetical protein